MKAHKAQENLHGTECDTSEEKQLENIYTVDRILSQSLQMTFQGEYRKEEKRYFESQQNLTKKQRTTHSKKPYANTLCTTHTALDHSMI